MKYELGTPISEMANYCVQHGCEATIDVTQGMFKVRVTKGISTTIRTFDPAYQDVFEELKKMIEFLEKWEA